MTTRLIPKFSQTQLVATQTIATDPNLGDLKAVLATQERTERVWFEANSLQCTIEQTNSSGAFEKLDSLSYFALDNTLESICLTVLTAIGDYLTDAYESEALIDGLSQAQYLLESALGITYTPEKDEEYINEKNEVEMCAHP